jgi:ElaB/YqjD/DUF883 family membrane-anchored ribosome-binding protein
MAEQRDDTKAQATSGQPVASQPVGSGTGVPPKSAEARATPAARAASAAPIASDASRDQRTSETSPIEPIKQEAGEFLDRARHTSGQLVDEVREAAVQILDEQKGRAADAVHGVADALRQTADTLHQRDNALVASYAERAAAEVERLSDAVRSRSLHSLVVDTEEFARRQPEWFLAGAAAAGFLLGRFIRASGERPHEGTSVGRAYGGTTVADQGAGYGSRGNPARDAL